METQTKLIQPTTKGKFTICPYQPEYEAQIFASWEKAFNKKIDQELWHWKYHANPAGFRTMLCLSEDGEVAVHYAAQVYKINHQGQTKLALHLTDNFSHPKYRWALGGKTGLFVKTSWAFLKTYLKDIPIEEKFKLKTSIPIAHFHYGFPGIRHYRLGAKLMYYRLFKPGTLYFKYNPKSSQTPTKNGLSFYKCESHKHPTPEEINQLWQKVLKSWNPFSIIRDYSFLKWRYFDKPNNNYVFWGLKTKFFNKLAAWLITTPESEKDDVIHIVDFLAQDITSLELLLKKFINKNKKKSIDCWCSGNHPQKNAFLKGGFTSPKEPLGIVPCTRCDEKGVLPNEADNFIWTIGDADCF